ncbi:MAG: acetate--CoA ligase family protein, partial [Chloroflexi bacterium]|nr:acetate--CoA ligase family protein [Chloroflexota bacterium]
VPTFFTAECCATALAAMAGPALGAATASGVRGSGGGRTLNEAEALALFAQYGVGAARSAVASTPAEAAERAAGLGSERVVVKILSRSVAHKSDVGGVRVGVLVADVAATCEELRRGMAASALEGWLVQEQVAGGTEMLLGVIRDAQLGLALVLGAGGTAAEVFGDISTRLLPLGPTDARDMLGELKSRVLLEGFRGQAPGDVEALVEAIERFGQMAVALGATLLEAEINPLFVLPRGQGVVAADGLVVLAR